MNISNKQDSNVSISADVGRERVTIEEPDPSSKKSCSVTIPPYSARDSNAIDRVASKSPKSLTESWTNHRRTRIRESSQKRFVVLCAEVCTSMAEELEEMDPDRFHYVPIDWAKFADGTDNITISGFSPENIIAGENVLFLASFHNNDVTLSQFSVLIVLLQSFIQSMTIVLPFYPVGTNERVESEGRVATANTYSILLSNLPSIGSPSRIMIYDIHALQNRFYFHNSTIPSLHSTIPLLFDRIAGLSSIKIAFPDDGAAKRFGKQFKEKGYDVIVCGKIRVGDTRKIHIAHSPEGIVGQSVIIIDDLVQTGGTLYECGKALLDYGASKVYVFVAHAVFPNNCWKDFLRNSTPIGKRAIFERFWISNSQPSVTNLIPTDDCFEIVDILPQVIKDLDAF